LIASPRQRQILELLAQGLSAKEIALRLAVSPRTVQKHLEHLHAENGFKTNCQAVARWVDERAKSGPSFRE
jgi:DNA-binding CsgD family transcriptional regulator